MKKDECKVTAVITTYKREWESIRRSVESVLSQTSPVEELLIIDDNPVPNEYSDVIRENAEKYPVIRYISLNGNFGVGYARNKAAEAAKGNLIGYLDDDDEWLPDKIEVQEKIFEEHPDAGLAFGVGRIFNDDLQQETGLTWSYSIFKEHPGYIDMLANDHVGSASHPLIRKEALRDAGGFRGREMRAVEDYELWIRIIRKYQAYGLKRPLYIKHMNNQEHVSRNHNRTFEGYLFIYQEFKEDYAANPYAHKRILRNVVREGAKAKRLKTIPYFVKWFYLNLKKNAKGEYENSFLKRSN